MAILVQIHDMGVVGEGGGHAQMGGLRHQLLGGAAERVQRLHTPRRLLPQHARRVCTADGTEGSPGCAHVATLHAPRLPHVQPGTRAAGGRGEGPYHPPTLPPPIPPPASRITTV